MHGRNHLLVGAILAASIALAAGCSDSSSQAAHQPAAHGDDHAGHMHGPIDTGDAAIAEALAQLSPEDRAAARRQKICPVSGEPLGSMGAPVKVHVNGRDVFICCQGCDHALLTEPEKYLGRLDQ